MKYLDEVIIDGGQENKSGDDGQITIDTNKGNNSRDLSYSATEVNGLNLFSNNYRENENIIEKNSNKSDSDFASHIFNDLSLTDNNYDDLQSLLFVNDEYKADYHKDYENSNGLLNVLILVFMFIIFGVFLMVHFIMRVVRDDNNNRDREDEKRL